MHWTDERLIGERAVAQQDEVQSKSDIGRRISSCEAPPAIEIANSIAAKTEFENFLLDDETGRVTYQTRYRAKLIASFEPARLPIRRAGAEHLVRERRARRRRGRVADASGPAGSNVASRLTDAKAGSPTTGTFAGCGAAAAGEHARSLTRLTRANLDDDDDGGGAAHRPPALVRRRTIMLRRLLPSSARSSWSVLWIDPTAAADRIAICEATLGSRRRGTRVQLRRQRRAADDPVLHLDDDIIMCGEGSPSSRSSAPFGECGLLLHLAMGAWRRRPADASLSIGDEPAPPPLPRLHQFRRLQRASWRCTSPRAVPHAPLCGRSAPTRLPGWHRRRRRKPIEISEAGAGGKGVGGEWTLRRPSASTAAQLYGRCRRHEAGPSAPSNTSRTLGTSL